MKHYTIRCLLLCYLILGGVTNSFAQKFKPKYLREKDQSLLPLTFYASDNGWLEFRQDKDAERVNPDEFFNRFGKSLGLGEGYHLKPTQDETDYREIRYQRFQLYYKNIRVEGAEYSLHSRNKQLRNAHGRIVEGLLLDVDKPMPERKALELALADQKLTTDQFKGRDLPKGELLIAWLGAEELPQNYKLCYAFEVPSQSEKQPGNLRIYVDATTGQVVQRVSLSSTCFGPARHSAGLLSRPVECTETIVRAKQALGPLTASTFTPFSTPYSFNTNRYFSAQGVGSFETELISTNLGQQYRLGLPNVGSIVRDALNRLPTGV